MKDGSVDANGMLPSYKIVDNLQHRPIKRGSVVKAKDTALDPASNAMYAAKVVLALSPLSVQCSMHPSWSCTQSKAGGRYGAGCWGLACSPLTSQQ